MNSNPAIPTISSINTSNHGIKILFKFIATIVSSLIVFSLSSLPAFAESAPGKIFPTHIVAVPGSPVVITKCTVRALVDQMVGTGDPAVTNDVYNRSSMHLVSYDILFTMYDHDGNVMGNPSFSFPPKNSIPPHDYDEGESSKLAGAFSGIQLTEPISALSRVSCKIVGAKFEGNKIWTYGHAWRSKLGVIPVARAFSNDQSTNNLNGDRSKNQLSSSSRSIAAPQISVANAWTDTLNGSNYVHDSVTINSGDTERHVTASNFMLTVSVSGGAKKSYMGMTQASPMFTKINPLTGNNMPAPSIDPATDLGRIGEIVIPAHTNITTTVTFGLADIVIDKSDIRNIVLK